MNIDNKQSIPEINKLHKLGLKMGLSANGVQQVLAQMNNYPDKEVPLAVIQEAFKEDESSDSCLTKVLSNSLTRSLWAELDKSA